MNPLAPEKILVGTGEDIERWATVFTAQQEFVPLFIKSRSNEWTYQGMYRVDRALGDPDVVNEYARQAGREDVTRVLCLERG